MTVSEFMALGAFVAAVLICGQTKAQQGAAPRSQQPTRLWAQPIQAPSESSMGPQLRGWDLGPRVWQPLRELGDPAWERGAPGYSTLPWDLPSAADEREFGAAALCGYGVTHVQRELLLEYPSTRESARPEQTGGVTTGLDVHASGPIVENRLGAFARVLDLHRFLHRPLGAGKTQAQWTPRYVLNLGYTPDMRTLVTLGGRFEGSVLEGAGQDPWTMPSASTLQKDTLGLVQLSLRRQLGVRQEIGARYGLRGAHQSDSSMSESDVPAHFALADEVTDGNTPFETLGKRFTHLVDFHWSTFLDGLFVPLDAHTLTLGLQLEASYGEQRQARTFGYALEDSTSVRGGELGATFRDESLAGYLEDSFKFGSRLRGNLGVRIEHFRGGFPENLTVWQTTTASPRVSLVAYLSEDLGSGLLAQYGHHYRNLDPSMYLRDSRGRAVTGLSYWDWTGDPLDAQEEVPGTDDSRWSLSRRFEPLSGKLSKDVKHPYADRLVVGGFSSLWEERLKLFLRYELLALRNPLAIFDEQFYAPDQDAYVFVRGPGATGTQTEYYRHNSAVERTYIIDNAKGASRNRHTVELVARVIPTSFLTLGLRGAFCEDKGHLPDDDGLSLEWSDPSGTLHSSGRMPGFHRFEAGAAMDWDFPAGVEFRARYGYFSGEYTSRRIRIDPADSQSPRMYVQGGAGRGAHRLPTRQTVDAQLEWQLPIPAAKGSVRLFFIAYNLLNAAVPIAIHQSDAAFGAVQDVQDPLELQLGLSCRY